MDLKDMGYEIKEEKEEVKPEPEKHEDQVEYEEECVHLGECKESKRILFHLAKCQDCKAYQNFEIKNSNHEQKEVVL